MSEPVTIDLTGARCVTVLRLTRTYTVTMPSCGQFEVRVEEISSHRLIIRLYGAGHSFHGERVIDDEDGLDGVLATVYAMCHPYEEHR